MHAVAVPATVQVDIHSSSPTKHSKHMPHLADCLCHSCILLLCWQCILTPEVLVIGPAHPAASMLLKLSRHCETQGLGGQAGVNLRGGSNLGLCRSSSGTDH